MKSVIKPLSLALVAAALSTQPAPAQTKPAANASLEDLFPDTVIVQAKNFQIKRSEFDAAISRVRAGILAQGREVAPADLPLIEKRTLDQLIQIRLVTPMASAADKAKAKEKADKQYEDIKKGALTEESLANQLKAVNMTVATFRDRLLDQALFEVVLRSKVNISDQDVKKYYDDNPQKFEEPERVRASHILLATADLKSGAQLSDDQKAAKRKLIDDLLKRARGGEDFAKLAKEYSEDPGAKETGGEYIFPRGRMVKEFEAAAFSLKTNQISDVVTTQFGYHIIKLSEKMPASKLPLSKVGPDIKSYLEALEIEKMLPDFIAKLRKENGVKVLDEQLKTLDESGLGEPLNPKKAK